MYVCITFEWTWPCKTSISPSIADMRDDFPQPTCPTTATRLPSGTDRFILEWKEQNKQIQNAMLIQQVETAILNQVFFTYTKLIKFNYILIYMYKLTF